MMPDSDLPDGFFCIPLTTMIDMHDIIVFLMGLTAHDTFFCVSKIMDHTASVLLIRYFQNLAEMISIYNERQQ